jgi:hypothetical protein
MQQGRDLGATDAVRHSNFTTRITLLHAHSAGGETQRGRDLAIRNSSVIARITVLCTHAQATKCSRGGTSARLTRFAITTCTRSLRLSTRAPTSTFLVLSLLALPGTKVQILTQKALPDHFGQTVLVWAAYTGSQVLSFLALLVQKYKC